MAIIFYTVTVQHSEKEALLRKGEQETAPPFPAA
jgi:hypothetical protein